MLATDLNAAIGNHESRDESYLNCLTTSIETPPYHHLQLQVGKTAMNLGLNDISLASLQEAMLVNPDDLETRHVLTDAYLKAGLNIEAFNTARASLQIAPADLDNVLWFSEFMSNQSSEKEAIQVLKDAIYLRPEEKTLYLTSRVPLLD